MPFPPPEDLPNPGIEPRSSALAGGFFTAEPPGKSVELLESSLKKIKKLYLEKKVAHSFKCSSRGTAYQVPWRTTVTLLHKQKTKHDNSPEIKLQVMEYCDPTDRGFKTAVTEKSNELQESSESSTSSGIKLKDRQNTVPKRLKLYKRTKIMELKNSINKIENASEKHWR